MLCMRLPIITWLNHRVGKMDGMRVISADGGLPGVSGCSGSVEISTHKE